MGDAWVPLVRQGAEALLAGRFGECERLAAQAAAAHPGGLAPGLLAVAACREQGRAAEAEILLRNLLLDHPDDEEGRALLAAVLADLGRDADAERQLDRIEVDAAPLVVCALAAEVSAVLRLRALAATLHGRIAAHESSSVGVHGSLARHLGLLALALGHWSDAADYFDSALVANREAGAPVLVAHTCRHYSAVLRLRGRDGDWDQAVGLLAEAADIYRRLEIDSRAEEAEAILRRSVDLDEPAGSRNGAFSRRSGGWDLSYAGRSAHVADMAGVAHLASLVAAPGRPLHVLDLTESQSAAWLRERLVAECRSRLGGLLDAPTQDPFAASLARAEQDRLDAELASLTDGAPTAGEVVDRARRLVTIRTRVALEAIDDALPELGRHLRRSIRTGTFCMYEPGRPGTAGCTT